MTAPSSSASPDSSTASGQANAYTPGDLLTDLLSERFPSAAAVAAEARRPIPAPTLMLRGTTPVTVDTMQRDANDLIRYQTRQRAAEARITAARKLTTLARRKAAS